MEALVHLGRQDQSVPHGSGPGVRQNPTSIADEAGRLLGHHVPAFQQLGQEAFATSQHNFPHLLDGFVVELCEGDESQEQLTSGHNRGHRFVRFAHRLDRRLDRGVQLLHRVN